MNFLSRGHALMRNVIVIVIVLCSQVNINYASRGFGSHGKIAAARAADVHPQWSQHIDREAVAENRARISKPNRRPNKAPRLQDGDEGNGNAHYMLFACPAFLVPDRAAEEAQMFTEPELKEWSTVASLLGESSGAYHFHDFLLAHLGTDEASAIANFFKQRPEISVSLEAGGYLCNGTDMALKTLAGLHNYTSAGGRIDQWALESIFSRTISGCGHKIKTFQEVAEQAADYVSVLKKAMPQLEFGVIDAVPHFSAGKFPANNETRVDLGDIRDALTLLKEALARVGTHLTFYWADCPYEYSINLPGNSGFEKLAFIANFTTNGLGIRMGKIFNSELGGDTSDKMFFDRTLEDYHQYMATASAADDTTDIIVESWYKFPAEVLPETQPYTFMYTAKTVLELAHHNPDSHGRHARRRIPKTFGAR